MQALRASLIKSIQSSVIGAFKHKKKNYKFHCDYTAQMESEICGILKR